MPQLDFTDIDYIRLRNVDKYSKKNSYQSDSVLIYFDKKIYPLLAIDVSEQKINGESIRSIKIETNKDVIETITGKKMKALLIINDDDQ